MPTLPGPARRIGRIVARGRDEKAAVYLHLGVVTLVGAFVAIVVGIALLVFYLS